MIIHQANAAAGGVFEACNERGVLAFGTNSDQKMDAPPRTVLASAVIVAGPAFLDLATRVKEGKFEAGVNLQGMKEGAVDLVWNETITGGVPQELKDLIEATKKKNHFRRIGCAETRVLSNVVQPVVFGNRLTKRFGAVTALDDVNIALYPGEIHAVLGENGAGKSTLVAILSGNLSPDEGHIDIEEKAVELRNARDARPPRCRYCAAAFYVGSGIYRGGKPRAEFAGSQPIVGCAGDFQTCL